MSSVGKISLILPLWIASQFFLACGGDVDADREEWEYEFIKSVKRQYGHYHEMSALIIKSKLYYWTEEDKVNLCYNINKELLDPPPNQLLRFKENQQPTSIEKMFRIQTKALGKQLKDIFWFVESVRCPIVDNTFYVIEGSRKNCYYTLTNSPYHNNVMIHITDEVCDVNVLNSAI